MESAKTPLEQLIKQACDWFDSLTPEEQAEHRRKQAESWVRSIVDWPKPNFHWENGVKVYHSFEDYCND
jgi:hypothetical protein